MITPHQHDFGWADIARVMSTAPARIGRVGGQGQPLTAGAPAHLTLIDPAAPTPVDPEEQASASRNTPYAGRVLPAAVRATFYAGRPTVLDGHLQDERSTS